MKRINVLIFIIIFLSSAPASGQFYKYVDEKGNIRFTDDINQVPEQQRATAKSYEEAVSATDVAEETTQSEASPEAQQETAAAEVTVDLDLEDLEAARKQLVAFKEEIDKEYNELVAEKDALAKEKAEAKTREQILQYNAKVEKLNERVKAYQEKGSLYETQVQAYNDKVAQQNAEQKKAESE